jgi:large subunit ribosomal protein L13
LRSDDLDGSRVGFMITISRDRILVRDKASMSTFMAKPSTITRRWFVIDATDAVVGRLAVQIANVLRGKHRPEYTPHLDTGEFVVVVNAEKVRFTGKKLETKTYNHYTRYPGGLKQVSARDLLKKHPDRILREAVRRMVPRNKLGRQQMTKLKIYAGPTHPHQAQQPVELKLNL